MFSIYLFDSPDEYYNQLNENVNFPFFSNAAVSPDLCYFKSYILQEITCMTA